MTNWRECYTTAKSYSTSRWKSLYIWFMTFMKDHMCSHSKSLTLKPQNLALCNGHGETQQFEGCSSGFALLGGRKLTAFRVDQNSSWKNHIVMPMCCCKNVYVYKYIPLLTTSSCSHIGKYIRLMIFDVYNQATCEILSFWRILPLPSLRVAENPLSSWSQVMMRPMKSCEIRLSYGKNDGVHGVPFWWMVTWTCSKFPWKIGLFLCVCVFHLKTSKSLE